jgi:hypothetical protein
MALDAYRTATLALLNDPTNTIYPLSQIDSNINLARVQVAEDAECIRQLPTLDTVAGQRSYSWGAAVFAAPAATTGIGGILNIRDISRQIPVGNGGSVKLFGRPWEWFAAFKMQSALNFQAIPTRWATFQPGSNGVFYVDPIPDAGYTLNLDAVCFPIPLVDDTTVEAVPDPWTTAVPYFAAYLSYLDQMRTADADAMYQRYWLYARRGTQVTTPSQLPDNFPGGMGAERAMGRKIIGSPAERSR